MPKGVTTLSGSRPFADWALFGLTARFVVCVTFLLGVVATLNARTGLIDDLMRATAGAAAVLINATGVAASHAGQVIIVPGRYLIIASECTGVSVAAVLVSLVVAYPVGVSSRVVGVFVGVSAIFVANLLRLVAVAHMSRLPDGVFTVAHDFLFQFGMVAVAIAVWVGWLSFVRARPDCEVRARTRFAVLFVVAAAVLYATFFWLATIRSDLWPLGYVPAVIAVMLAAQGVSRKRRLLYAGVTAGVLASLFVVATVLGAVPSGDSMAMVGAPMASRVASKATWEFLFLAVPFAALALFVGRRPSVLWTAQSGSRD